MTSLFESLIECGTEELRSKHVVEFEAIDLRGVFRRARVLDQTYLDTLFLKKKINAPQYSAGEEYMDLLLRAGAFLRSPSMEAGIEQTGRDKSRSMTSRIMAVSGARTRLRKEAGPEATLAVDLAVGGNTRVRVDILKLGLDVLVSYFGTSGVNDPRDV